MPQSDSEAVAVYPWEETPVRCSGDCVHHGSSNDTFLKGFKQILVMGEKRQHRNISSLRSSGVKPANS